MGGRAMTLKTGRGVTYSPRLPGDRGNYGWSVTLDHTDDGYVGITQTQDGTTSRVLLSPQQVRSLRVFLRRRPTGPARP